MKRVFAAAYLAAVMMTSAGCGVSRSYSDVGSEPVNQGYGSIKRDLKTNSSSTVKARQSETVTYTNMLDYLRGRVPGLSIGSNGSISIRGVSTINGDSTPLFVVDGVIVPSLDTIDPSMVESVEVIKDGTSAIYGMQGANGVILVTMKK